MLPKRNIQFYPHVFHSRPMFGKISSSLMTIHGRNGGGFGGDNNGSKQSRLVSFSSSSSSDNNSSNNGYRPPEQSTSNKKSKLPPQPKIGDTVRYYDLDGGNPEGEIKVGRITLIQPQYNSNYNDNGTNNNNNSINYLCEITQLEDVGDGYYAEYPSRKRNSVKTWISLEKLSPLVASYVRSEDAYKIPLTIDGLPKPLFPTYDVKNYKGPPKPIVNENVVDKDLELYGDLKLSLLKNSFLTGLVGTLLLSLAKGPSDGIVYGIGALAGVGYLFFLSIKTDTLGSMTTMTTSNNNNYTADIAKQRFGSNVSNLRFALPFLVLAGISLQNISQQGGAEGIYSPTLFRSVTPEQFACAMLGFLTYRIPLFATQLLPLIMGDSTNEGDGSMTLPGSAGVLLNLANSSSKDDTSYISANNNDNLVTVLLVSGPAATGRTELVQRLMKEYDDNGDTRFVLPKRMDAISEPISFEQAANKQEFLDVDDTGRYGLLADGILKAPSSTTTIVVPDDTTTNSPPPTQQQQQQQVVVMDASVDLAKKLTQLGGTRLIGVWVGLDSLEKFQSRLEADIDNGFLKIPDGETRESLIRAKIKDIVKEIEYGVVSGIFEFTILNDDEDSSLAQLRDAAEYCFR
eukprot:CAMPEP_0184857352 /NCGR_PEP_ID=MMETSP0580-20130426/2524_1 /TAXON_ID=1118495 /ORGANISM="Dactyliosolen fragilissimus" /LENGTH=628 /DNA_ID=CAMNT_0027352913 /DNA_START=224 /DNA_END=2110 /DNA_ORIENTATION=-